jgi:hypothetical protein
MRIPAIVLACGLLAPAAALAQNSAPPKPDFSSFAFLNGTWSCAVTKDDGGHLAGTSYTMSFSADPNGYWNVSTSGHHVKRYLSHDAGTSRWVLTALYDDGGSSVSTSPGWSGDSITFLDAFNSDGSPLGYAVVTKQSERAYTVHAGNGSPTTPDVYEESCTKS